MNTTIKKRIEEINSGRVPEGYEKTSFGIYPCDWEKVSLGEVSAKKGEYGLNAPACEYKEGLPKYLRITDIDDQGRYIDNNACVNDADSRKYVLNKGDIVFARTGASVGKNYIYDEKDGILVYAGFLIKFSIKPQYNAYLICTNCRTKKYDNWVAKMCARSGQPGINAEEYATYSFIIPKSAQEQSRIAEILTQWDKAIELQEKYIKQLELRKKALMQRLLTPKEGWTCKLLAYYFYKEKGKNVAISVEGKKPIIDMDYAINNRAINFSNDLSGVFALDNEIIILWDGASAGKVLYGIKGIVGSTFCVLRQLNKINSKYVYFYLDYAYEKNKKTREGSGIPHMPKDFLKKQAIWSPENILEQNKIANILTQSDLVISLQTQKLDKLIKQRKALQQYLLTGIVRVW